MLSKIIISLIFTVFSLSQSTFASQSDFSNKLNKLNKIILQTASDNNFNIDDRFSKMLLTEYLQDHDYIGTSNYEDGNINSQINAHKSILEQNGLPDIYALLEELDNDIITDNDKKIAEQYSQIYKNMKNDFVRTRTKNIKAENPEMTDDVASFIANQEWNLNRLEAQKLLLKKKKIASEQ